LGGGAERRRRRGQSGIRDENLRGSPKTKLKEQNPLPEREDRLMKRGASIKASYFLLEVSLGIKVSGCHYKAEMERLGHFRKMQFIGKDRGKSYWEDVWQKSPGGPGFLVYRKEKERV